jgi:negative regulator of sigma-B (phosphoserine phosphatase)
MTPALDRDPAHIDWGFANAGLHGGESGDLHVVVPLPHGALFAAIDGLGHGPEAALAAREAASILRMHAGLPVLELITRCHEGLKKTRGAVMSLAALDSRSARIEWCGVGNIESVLLRADTTRPSLTMITRGGVIGYRLPPLRVSTLSASPRDVLVMVSDGIRSGFTQAVDLECEPQAIAETVLARYAKGSDDALVFVARCPGASP